jgi:hypothetical protein
VARRLLQWLDTRRLATIILFVALFALATRVPLDTDTWWHLLAGRVTLESGRILQTDLFSHTRYGSPWVNHSWLSQVVLAWLFDHFSDAGLGFWTGAVVVASFALVYRQMEGDPLARAFIVVLAATTSAVIWSPRPQLFSFLLTAAVAYVLHLFKWRKVNRLWLLPPLFALWVNLHAGYALGFMVLLAFVAGEVLNRALARLLPSDDPVLGWREIGMVVGMALLSALLLVLNPNTTRMWTYYLDTAGIGALQDFIQEWRSPDFHLLHMQPFAWLLLATLAVFGLSGRRVDGVDLTLSCLFTYAALLAARNVGPFALLICPMLSRHVAALLARLRRAGQEQAWLRPRPRPTARARTRMGALNLVLLVVVVTLAGLQVGTSLDPATIERTRRETLPVEAVAYIRENRPPGEMFNPYDWGGYLAWKLWPDYRVFVDGRTDLYGDELLRQVLEIQLARPGFEQTLAGYDVRLVLTRSDDALAAQLACLGWDVAYTDETATVWVQDAGEQ